MCFTFFKCSATHQHLHSFPTRRSSDLPHRRHGAGPEVVADARALNVWRRWGYRLLPGDLFSYLLDRKSTRLNSSHTVISYAVFCLKKKKLKTEISEGIFQR